MKDLILVVVLALVFGLAAFYVYRAKKSGKKCIGCPDGGSCSSKEGCTGCGCVCTEKNASSKNIK